MLAREIMTRDVTTFRVDTPAAEAAAVLAELRITAAPVLDGNDDLVGMVSEADLIAGRFSHDARSHARRDLPAEPPPARTVGELMTASVVAMSGSVDMADLAATMLECDVRSVPIVEGGTVVGIVSRRDLLRLLARPDWTAPIEGRAAAGQKAGA
jgi:CBS domain-containing protein